MSTECDELAELLYDVDADDWRHHSANETADAILAAGYRKPRTVTTVEELDALPVGAVVVDAYAAKCVLVDADRDHLSWRRVTTAVHGGEHRHKPYLPATVLHEGSVA